MLHVLVFQLYPQVQKAIEYLKIIGALDENEQLTALGKRKNAFIGIIAVLSSRTEVHLMCLKFSAGRYLAKLPMEPKLGKMLILGAILGCLDPILTVAAGLSVRDPFLTPLDKKDVSLSPTMYKIKCSSTRHLALYTIY